jgi:hypothetical protein
MDVTVFVRPKADGTLRLGQDFRGANQATKLDPYSLPTIVDILDNLGGAKVFSTMDAASGFYQVPLKENDIGKTGFTCKYGTFEYELMPLELKDAAATFQRLMNRVIADYLGLFVMVYIDDMWHTRKAWKSTQIIWSGVFKRLREANIKLKWKKCLFGFNTIHFWVIK